MRIEKFKTINWVLFNADGKSFSDIFKTHNVNWINIERNLATAVTTDAFEVQHCPAIFYANLPMMKNPWYSYKMGKKTYLVRLLT